MYTKEQVQLLATVHHGADVFDRGLASFLRGVERNSPELIEITEPMEEYDGVSRLPYFGAILTTAGRKIVDTPFRSFD